MNIELKILSTLALISTANRKINVKPREQTYTKKKLSKFKF